MGIVTAAKARTNHWSLG